MARMTLKNISAVKLAGKLPGQMFTVELADDGLPADGYWRRRIDEDRKFNGDNPAVEIIDPVPVSEPAPASAASPEPAPVPATAAPAMKKGR